MRAVANQKDKAGPSRARRVFIALLLVAFLAGSPGCWGSREIEERSFVTLMGFDLAKDGRLLVSIMVAVPRAFRGGGMGTSGGSGTGGASYMMSGVGRNIEDALRSIELQNSRQLSTVYLTFVVLGEEFAKRDVSSVIDVFSRHLHYKPSTLVMVCRDSANQFLSGIQSQEEIEPSQALLKLITTGHEDLSGCPLVTMHDFMVAYNTQTSSPMAPYVGLASPVSAEQESEEGPEEKPGKSQDGGSDGGGSKSSGKVARVLGTALFTNVDSACLMAGTLDTFETMGALMLANELTSGLIEFSYPGDQAESTMLIHHVDSFIDLSLGRDEIEVRFRVVLTASLSESAVSGDLPEKEQEFRKGVARTVEQQIHALLHKTFEKITAADSDILGLARSAQTKFATHGEWEEFDWPSRFAGIKATIDVKVHLLTYGFILEKPAPR